MSIRMGSRKTGFSLVEVVLALGVIAFSLVAILGVFPSGMRANRLGISDTRASQVATAITATIKAQENDFSSVDCFGLALNLSTLTAGSPAQLLYVRYPDPDRPEISPTATPDVIYTVELRFNNDPEVAPGLTLGPGRLNRIEIRVYPRSRNEGFAEFFQVVRNAS